MITKEDLRKHIDYLYSELFDVKSHLFNYSITDTTKSAYINGHIAWVLSTLGEREKSKSLIQGMRESKLFDDKSGLLRYSATNDRPKNSDKNFGANLSFLRALYLNNDIELADKHLKLLYENFFNKEKGLFCRSERDNLLFVAQPNLWMVDLLVQSGKISDAKDLYAEIVKQFYDEKIGLVVSKSSTTAGKYKTDYIFPDDNALFIKVANYLDKEMAENVKNKLLRSPLYSSEECLFNKKMNIETGKVDRIKSLYKNAVCIFMLTELIPIEIGKVRESFVKNLFDIENKRFSETFADSLFLSLLAVYSDQSLDHH